MKRLERCTVMKKILQKYTETNLIIRILIGLIIGTIIGIAAPSWTAISIFGDIFVGALKAVAPVLVFILVISALANAGKGIGKRFRTVIILYMLSTFLAAFVAVIFSKAFPVTLTLAQAQAAEGAAAPEGIGEVLKSLITNMVANPVKSLMEANYIGILTWAVIFGLAVKSVGNAETKSVLDCLSKAVTKAVQWIINIAPFGIMGLVFTTVSENGLDAFTTYGKLLAVLV